VAGLVAGPAVYAAAMAALGLSTIGPVAGGAFAISQSAGMVTAGSVYACCQSAVMTSSSVLIGVVQLVTAATGSAGG